MNRFESFLFAIIGALTIAFVLVTPALSQEETPVTVSEASLCLDVVDLSCVGENDLFPVEAGKIYCFCRVLGAQSPTTITHVWYYKDLEMA